MRHYPWELGLPNWEREVGESVGLVGTFLKKMGGDRNNGQRVKGNAAKRAKGERSGVGDVLRRPLRSRHFAY